MVLRATGLALSISHYVPVAMAPSARLAKQRRQWDSLYGQLSRTRRTRDGHINFPHGLGRLTRVRPFKSFGQSVGFGGVKCARKTIGRRLIARSGQCKDHRSRRLLSRKDPGRYKVFVRGYRNLYDYGQAIQRGEVTRQMHTDLYREIRAQQRALEGETRRKTTIINHNEDVPVLHFKFACSGDRTCGHTRQ
jgi:hypothetical protein